MEIVTHSKEDTKIVLTVLSNKDLIKQLLKILGIIKALINSNKSESINIRINNVYGSKLSIYVNEDPLIDLPNNKREIVIGE
jgi:uncharacterized membrane protein